MKPMRTLVIFGTGIAAGIAIARKVGADEPEVLHGPVQKEAGNPALRLASAGLARAGDRATVASLDAIRRAREVIGRRLAENGDDAAWG